MDEHRGVVKVVLGILLFALTSVTYADDNDVPKEFDVCVDPTLDVVPDLVGAPHTFPGPGDGFVGHCQLNVGSAEISPSSGKNISPARGFLARSGM